MICRTKKRKKTGKKDGRGAAVSATPRKASKVYISLYIVQCNIPS